MLTLLAILSPLVIYFIIRSANNDAKADAEFIAWTEKRAKEFNEENQRKKSKT